MRAVLRMPDPPSKAHAYDRSPRALRESYALLDAESREKEIWHIQGTVGSSTPILLGIRITATPFLRGGDYSNSLKFGLTVIPL